LRWNGSAWINDAVNLSTDTVGSYVESLVAGTGVFVTNNSGEATTPTIAIGQDVSSSVSPTFAGLNLNGNITFEGTTANDFETIIAVTDPTGDRVIVFPDLTGTVVTTGDTGTVTSLMIADSTIVDGDINTAAAIAHSKLANATAGQVLLGTTTTGVVTATTISGDITIDGAGVASIAANSVALGTDTTGNYVSGVSQGTGVTVTHTPGEGSTATIAIGQDVATSASVSFAKVTTTGDVVVGGDLTVNGTTTTLNTENLLVEDNIIVLNSNVSGSPSVNAGIEIERGDSTNVVLRWNESSDSWEITEDGSVYKNISTGQDVETTASVSFAAVTASTFTGPLVGNASTASALQTARTVSLTGDVTGSVSFSGSADVSITATIAENSVALGTDTTGNYVSGVSQGTGITVSHTPGEGSTATIAVDTAVIQARVTNVTDTEIGYLDGVTSAIQTQLDTKAPTASPTFTGTVTLPDNTVALGTKTTGDYVASLVQGTGVTISNNSGEGTTPTIAIGQAVGTSASVTFAKITMSGPVDSSNTVATKQYVDQVAAGIDWHESVALASAAALPNTPTYDNGSSGDGATLTAGANARLNLDGANAVTGTRVLVKNQVNATHNGVYDVTEQGSVSVPWVLTRAEDFDGDTGHEVYGGEAVFVTGGTVNIRQGFTVTSTGSGTEGAHEFGTDNVNFTQFTGTASFIAGDGLAQDGNTISVGTASTDRITVASHAIDLATVSQTNTTGSDGTSFVQSHSVDSYGRVTGTVTATVQDGGTSQKGIARFNSDHFSVSSGSVSIGQAVGTSSSVTFAAVNAPLTGNVTGNADTATQLQTARTISLSGDVTGSVSFSGSADASITATIAANSVALGTDTTGNYVSGVSQGTGVTVSHTPGEGSTATISIGQDVATSANPTFSTINITNSASVNGGAIRTSVSGSTVSLNMKSASAISDIFGISYTQGATGTDSALISLKDFAGASDAAVIRLSQSTSSVGVSIGPRVVINSASAIANHPAGSSSVALFLNQSSSSSVGIRIKDSMGTMGPAFEVVSSDMSSSSVAVSIAGAIDGYRFFANSASLTSASITNDLTVGGNLTVNGTTVTVNSTTVTIDDPIFTLGGDTAPGSDDNKDRGIEFRYHSGTAASVGFMGYDDSAGMFTFLVGATNSSEVFSGTAASVNVGMLYIGGAQIAASNLSNGTTGSGSVALSSGPTISSASLSGSTAVSGSVGFDASASVTLPAKTFFPEEYLTVSSSVTLSSTTHRYATLEMTSGTGTSVISVPTDASDNFPVGTVIQIIRVGAGEVQVTAVTPGTTTVNNALGTRLRAQWSTATLRKRAANTWLLSGDLKV
jgi:hypothetical protein